MVYRVLRGGTWLALAVYLLRVVWAPAPFSLAIAFYLPSVVFLLGVLTVSLVRNWRGFVGAGVAGLGLSLFAAVIQSQGWTLHPVYLNANTVYHLVQFVGLLFLFYFVREWTNGPPVGAQE